jgi:outer membrane biosynthesis protein TonB
VRKKLLSAFAGATLVLSLTAGCQSTPPDITLDQAEAFQSRVLAITGAVAEGGYAAALDALTALETELDAAAAAGSVSFARHQRIEAAMTAVRADVQAAIDAQAVPEPEPAPAPAPEKTTAPVQEITPAPETDAEKKAREKAEEEARKAGEEERKAAEQSAEDAREAAEKAREDAKKKAERDAKNTETPAPEDDEED